MLTRTLLALAAAIEALTLNSAARISRSSPPEEVLAAFHWAGLLSFALAVVGGVLCAREMKGRSLRNLCRVLVVLAISALALTVLGARPARWDPAALQQAAVWGVALAALALLA